MTRLFIIFCLFLVVGKCQAQLVMVDPYRFGAAPGNNLLTDLEAAWRFEETSGAPQDSSGNARHLTHYGTTESESGILGNSRYHSSAENDDYFGIASAAWNTFGSGDFTIAYWFRSDGTSGGVGDQVHVAKSDINDDTSWGLGIDRGVLYPSEFAVCWFRSTDGTLVDYNANYGSHLYCEIPTTIAGGTDWICVVMTRSGNTFTLRLGLQGEGSFFATASQSEAITLYDNSTVPLTIGSYLSGGAVVTTQDNEGPIDEVMIWSRALSDCEIFKYFNAGVGRSFTTYDANPCL